VAEAETEVAVVAAVDLLTEMKLSIREVTLWAWAEVLDLSAEMMRTMSRSQCLLHLVMRKDMLELRLTGKPTGAKLIISSDKIV